MTLEWSAAQYARFEAERNRPSADLLAQLPTGSVARAADLGCGPGNSTALLQRRFSEADVVGIDSSSDMIAAARKRLPATRFVVADIATWQAPGQDVILANAALQWVPDHAALLPALLASLAPGGRLAVQIPDNLDEPAHLLMRSVAAEGPWAAKLAGAGEGHAHRHDAAWYYRQLRASVGALDIWRTTYLHELPGGPQAVVEWFKGTSLRSFLAPLAAGEQAAFLERYGEAIAQAYPIEANGAVLLPFPRLFFVATR